MLLKDVKKFHGSREAGIVIETENVVLDLEQYREILKEPYMSDKQMTYFFNVLKGCYSALSKEMEGFKVVLQAGEQLVDEVDRASNEENQRMCFRASDRCRKLQKKVKAAIERIQNCDYGYCKTCGSEIGLARLEVRPTADQCINCKTVAEMHEQRSGG